MVDLYNLRIVHISPGTSSLPHSMHNNKVQRTTVVTKNKNIPKKKKKKDKRKRILCIRWISEIFHFFISKIITLPNRNAEKTRKKRMIILLQY